MSSTSALSPETRRGIVRRVIQVLVVAALWQALLLLSAGAVRWPAAWIYLGLIVTLLVTSLVVVLPRNPEVIAERSRRHAGTKRFDVVVGVIFPLAYLAVPIVAGLDHRWSWSTLPAVAMGIGLGVVALGQVPITAAMAVNPFLERTVRVQAEREHRVIDRGPYAVVRHPMYVGVVLQHLGIPLVLGAAWAFVPVAAVVVTLVIRTALEDRTLRAELPGYAAYAERTRARLVPGVW